MAEHLNCVQASPQGFKLMRDLQECVENPELEHPSVGAGEDARLAVQRLRVLPGQAQQGRPRRRRNRAAPVRPRRVARGAPFYSEREERATLSWTKALTRIADNDLDDQLYAEFRKQFSNKELADLTLAIVAINGWSRLAIESFRTPPYPSTHNLGTCRMGKSAKDSVCNGWGQTHDVPNLFISDGSRFMSGGAENPTLTIVTRAIRRAEYIGRQMKEKAI